MTLPVIVISAGGHARVLISVLKTLNITILGITEAAPDRVDDKIKGLSIIGGDDKILDYLPDTVALVNGIGSIATTVKRKAIYVKFKNAGYSFANVIHPSAMIMDDVQLGEGVQIMAGAIVQPGCVIGDNSIINTGAIVDHDCMIGEHVHVAPGAVLSGGVHIGAMTHIGTSAAVIQGVQIGQAAVIGAGSVVVNNILPGIKVVGVPAREMNV
jgi:sugar O-acyltransferase (sialic acid O-acetyltransferase NeuD family)